MPRSRTRSTRHLEEEMSAGSRKVLLILHRSWQYAQAAKADDWDYAEEIAALRALGASNADFRWLLQNGLVIHAVDTAPPGSRHRQFRPISGTGLPRGACFILSELGKAVAQELVDGVPGPAGDRPRWRSDVHRLYVGPKCIKSFRRNAPSQRMILDAFEEEGWPERIDDPLPQDQDGDRDAKQRLHDTIKRLNKNQSGPHKVIFSGDGTGQGIVWALKKGRN